MLYFTLHHTHISRCKNSQVLEITDYRHLKEGAHMVETENQRRERIWVKVTNKNLGYAVISNDWYVKERYRQLNYPTTYSYESENDKWSKTLRMTKKWTKNAISTGTLSQHRPPGWWNLFMPVLKTLFRISKSFINPQAPLVVGRPKSWASKDQIGIVERAGGLHFEELEAEDLTHHFYYQSGGDR